ncbi:MAG: NDP-sugar synthase [Clostridia bacterium]|nr:NDP-sugar synthase [Clostridia bacterium]
MKAMVMAAGVGTRLEPLTYEVPKPMVPVVNRPVMEHIIGLLQQHGITDIIANTYYLPGRIKEYFGDGRDFGVNLHYSQETKLMGTAGGVKNNQWFLDDTFVVVSGDALTDINLRRLIDFHKSRAALATIALKRVEDVSKFGVVITDETGRIRSFQEKPKQEEALSDLVNTGIYVFEPEIFKLIPDGEVYDFGKQLFPLLVNLNAPFYGWPIDDYWCDIGSLETYREANFDVLMGRVKVNIPGEIDGQGIWLEDGVQVHNSAQLIGKIMLGRQVIIEPDVTLAGKVIIGPKCVIKKGSVIQDSIIWANTIVEENASVTASIIGNRCTLGKGSVLKPGVIIADGVKVPMGEEVPAEEILGRKTVI